MHKLEATMLDRYLFSFSVVIILLSAILIPAFPQPPDVAWLQHYGGAYKQHCYDMRQTSDGGFILTGNSRETPSSYENLYLVRTDQMGDTLWSRVYPKVQSQVGRSVQETPEGDFIVGGTLTYLNGYDDMYLIKTNANGDTLWTKTYGGQYDESCFSVQVTSDGGYIFAGNSTSFGTSCDVYVVKTDADGDVEWQRVYDGGTDENCNDIQQTSDGGYIIAGRRWTYNNSFDAFLIKTDGAGDTLWTYNYGGEEANEAHAVRLTSDGGYVLTGYSESPNGYDVYLVKTDSLGNEEWSRGIQNWGLSVGLSLEQTSDDGYIVAGYIVPFNQGDENILMVRTDSVGDTLWTKTLGMYDDDMAQSVVIANDGCYAFAGYINFNTSIYTDFVLYKLAEEEYPYDVIVDLEYISGSPVPPTGGAICFNIDLENQDSREASFLAWLEIAYDDNPPVLIASRSFQNCSPGWIFNLPNRNYPILENYPSGSYTMIGNTGIWPYVWHQDSFDFQKTGVSDGSSFEQGAIIDNWNLFDADNPKLPKTSYSLPITVSPNPFNPITTIIFDLPVASEVRFDVYNLIGARVGIGLEPTQFSAGSHSITFDGSNLSSGIYIYRLEADRCKVEGKMILLK